MSAKNNGRGIFNPRVNTRDKQIATEILRQIDGRQGFYEEDVNMIREALCDYRSEIVKKAGVSNV